jgi:hypothetical protein
MKIVSIHSSPRSGSTWIQSVLQSHPKITTRFQPLFSYRYKNIINDDTDIDAYNHFIEGLINTDDEFVLCKSEFHQKNNININCDTDHINNTTLVMKNVHNHNQIINLIRLNPDIKIIGLIRHPCAVVNSFIKCKNEYDPFSENEPLPGNEWLYGSKKNIDNNYFWGYIGWIRTMNIFLHIKEVYPDNIIFIQYEKLITDPNNEFQKLFQFINLEFDNKVRDFLNDHTNNNNDIHTIHSDYSIYNYNQPHDKWKEELDKDIQKYIFENLLSKHKIYEFLAPLYGGK